MKITRQQLRRVIREAEGNTEKYNDDSALKGDQSKLPDALQKGIIDKSVDDREEREEEDREEKNESIRITRRQLVQIIKESIDVINASTGEMMMFADEPDENGLKPDAPEAAAREIINRLKLNQLEDTDNYNEPGVEEIYLGAEDYAVMDVEVGGKRHARKNKKERARVGIDNLLARLDRWAEDAGSDFGADNPDVDMQDVAWDLSDSAQFVFKQDEWDELMWHFDGDEDNLRTYAADIIAR